MSMTHRHCSCFKTFHLAPIGSVYGEVEAERLRAHLKHKDHGGSREDSHWFERSWGDVLSEEVGEVHKIFCEFWLNNIDMDELKRELRKELVQVAAMATAWVDSIDRGGSI